MTKTEGPFYARVIHVIQEKRSANGNPRFRLILQATFDQPAMPIEVWTAPDSCLGYSVKNIPDSGTISFEYRTVRGRATLAGLRF